MSNFYKRPEGTCGWYTSDITEKEKATIQQIATAEGLTLQGVNLIGWTPYVNFGGLLQKLKKQCSENGTTYSIFTSPATIIIGEGASQAAVRGRDSLPFPCCIEVEARIEIYDPKTGHIDVFVNTGVCSPNTASMPAMKIYDNIAMMARTRAICRALRLAVGVGITSIEELPSMDDVKQDPPPQRMLNKPEKETGEMRKKETREIGEMYELEMMDEYEQNDFRRTTVQRLKRYTNEDTEAMKKILEKATSKTTFADATHEDILNLASYLGDIETGGTK